MANKAMLLIAMLGAIGCGPEFKCGEGETYCADGIPVYLEPGFPENYYNDPTFADRIAAQIGVALQFWGVRYSDLKGYRIIYAPAYVECGNLGVAWGCWDKSQMTISTVSFANLAPGCIEYSVLSHEIGHLHDEGHSDARWCSTWDAPMELLWSQPECAPLTSTNIDYDPLLILKPPYCRYD